MAISGSMLGYSDSQRTIAESFRDYVESVWSRERARERLERNGTLDGDLWDGLAGQGWVGAFYPESVGGQGLSFGDVAAMLREAGRLLLPSSFLSSAVLTPLLLLRMPGEQRFQTRLAAGSAIGAVALWEQPLRFPHPVCEARVNNGSLSGSKVVVADASTADYLLVLAREDERLVVAIVEGARQGVKRSSMHTLDGSNLGTVELDSVPVLHTFPISVAEIEDYMMSAAVCVTALQVGGAEAVLDMTVDYANQREQFGRLIAAFQAVSHRLADMYCALALGRALHLRALRSQQSGAASRHADASAAKARNNDMFRFVANSALQLHGGIGFTYEHDIHLYLRAAQVLAAQFGTTAHHKRLLKRQWLGEPAPATR